jgi:hypothetical protein
MSDDGLLDRRRAALSALLRETDLPVPSLAFPAGRIAAARRRRLVVRWRMAAAIAVLLSGAAMVRPVRAWIVETARGIWAASVRRPAAAPVAPAAPAAAPAPANAVTFTPRAGILVVEVAVRQAGGRLRLERGTGPSVTAALIGDAEDAELRVFPDGVRIANRAEATADYAIRLPAGVTSVVIRIGGETPLRLPALAEGEGASVRVSAPGGRRD